MVELIGFVAIIAVVYVLKAVSISKTHELLAENCASFSWASAREEDAAMAESWTVEEEPQETDYASSLGAFRRIGGARA